MTYNFGVTATSLPQVNLTSRRKLAIIGDDNSASTAGTFKSPTVAWTLGNTASWWVYALAVMGWPYELCAISAAAGRTSATAASAFSTEVAPFTPEEVWIMIGVNDMTSLSAAQTALTSFDSIVSQCLAVNPVMNIIVSAVPPPTANTSTYQQAVATYNYGLMRRAQNTPNIIFIDTNTVLRNSTSATSLATTAYMTGATTITSLGHGIIGQYWANTIAAIAPSSVIRTMGTEDYFGANTGSLRLLANATFATTTGGTVRNGATGTCPTGWLIDGGPGQTLVTPAGSMGTPDTSPYPRNWLQVTMAGGASSAGNAVYIIGGGLASPSIITPGTTAIRARVDIKTSSLTSISSIYLDVQGSNSGFSTLMHGDAGLIAIPTGQSLPTFPAAFTLEIPFFVVPSGVVNWEFDVLCNYNTAVSPTGTIQISNPVLEVVI